MSKSFSFKKASKSLSLISICIAILFTSTISFAYNLTGWKMPSTHMSFDWGDRLENEGSIIRQAFGKAVSSWYGECRINFYPSPSSSNILNSWYESSSTYYGTSRTYVNNKKIVTKFEALVNAGNSNITKSNVARSTATHELGHVMGLDHTSNNSIMDSSRDRTKIYTPQKDDINGVNAIYK